MGSRVFGIFISHHSFVPLSNRDTQIFQLATNEPLFPLDSFGCSVDEVHRNVESVTQKLIENGSQKFAAYNSEKLPNNFGIENVAQLAYFLWSMLQENPQNRKPTTALLDHPFIVGPKGC